MKKINIKWVAVLALVSMLSSCLKNNEYYTDFSSAAASVQLPLAARNSNKIITLAYTPGVGIVKIPVYVNVASPQTPTTATTTKLGIDTAFLRSYNTANNTHYEVLPDSVYTTTGWDRTIPAGKRLDSMVASINIDKMNLSHSYVLPITIVNASLPIEQWNHLFMNIAVKNKYDGLYHSTGVFHHPTAGDRAINRDKTLSTAGPNSVTTELGDLGGSGYLMTLTVNPDNTVTITPAGVTPNIDQHWGPNTYDPATKTFHLNYSYNTAAPRIVQEDIVHK